MNLLRVFALAAIVFTASAATAETTFADTKTFVVTALSIGNFIDEAGRIALATESGKAAKDFARASIFDQSDARDRLSPWADATRPLVTGRSAVVSDDLPGPLADLSAQLSAFTGVSKTADASLSRTAGGLLISAGQLAQLDELQNRTGGDFDRDYVDSQRRAYATLEAAYRAYADAGDDPALRAAARRELPILRRQIKRLGVF